MIDDGIDGVLLDRKRRRWGWGSFATCHVCTALKFICSGKSLCPFYMKPVTSIFPFIIAAPTPEFGICSKQVNINLFKNK